MGRIFSGDTSLPQLVKSRGTKAGGKKGVGGGIDGRDTQRIPVDDQLAGGFNVLLACHEHQNVPHRLAEMDGENLLHCAVRKGSLRPHRPPRTGTRQGGGNKRDMTRGEGEKNTKGI